jgi:hypothetical protein
MLMQSDATIELKDRWSLASSTARRRFRDIVIQGCEPPRSSREPYAAVIRIWLGLCPEDRQEMLDWMESRLSAQN